MSIAGILKRFFKRNIQAKPRDPLEEYLVSAFETEEVVKHWSDCHQVQLISVMTDVFGQIEASWYSDGHFRSIEFSGRDSYSIPNSVASVVMAAAKRRHSRLLDEKFDHMRSKLESVHR